MKKQQKAVIVLIVTALAAAGYWRWQSSRTFHYAGTVEATEIDLSSRLTSVIEAYDVKESDEVKAGQTLVRFTCEEQKLAADIAEKDFRRAERLIRGGSIPQESFDRLKYTRDDAVLKSTWCVVVAPEDGKILQTYQEAGERVTPGTKLLTVANLNEVYAYYYVPQPMLSKLKLGMEVEGFLAEQKGKTFKGRISHIRDEAEFTPKNVQTRDERTRLVYGVKVTFANPDAQLKPGMTVESKLVH
jgi:HlyD family secretion protein